MQLMPCSHAIVEFRTILAQRCSKALIWIVCCMIRPHDMTCISFQDLHVFHPPDLPQWIVVLSPVPMHFDAELGELLKIFGVQQMDRVSFEEINVPVWSIETAMDLIALRSYGLQLTLLEAGPVTDQVRQPVPAMSSRVRPFPKQLKQGRCRRGRVHN
ncbi:unnamed protein product [Durusdinium trenchii]|uniref:Uncharacterized protein n=1 Tax=Durusdinium trenchii TaxID=1381693 RepID=A0ABP0P5D7_9DINO